MSRKRHERVANAPNLDAPIDGSIAVLGRVACTFYKTPRLIKCVDDFRRPSGRPDRYSQARSSRIEIVIIRPTVCEKEKKGLLKSFRGMPACHDAGVVRDSELASLLGNHFVNDIVNPLAIGPPAD